MAITSVSDGLKQIQSLVVEAQENAIKFEKGNASAGKRVRDAVRQIKPTLKEIKDLTLGGKTEEEPTTEA